MTSLLALMLIATPAELPALAEANRFPSLTATEAQLGALIRLRCLLKQTMPSKDRDAALAFNTMQLAAWEALLEALGGGSPRRKADVTTRIPAGGLRGGWVVTRRSPAGEMP